MHVEAMRVRRSRDAFVQRLERELGHRLPYEHDPRDRLDLWALVETCLDRPGALQVLVDVLETVLGRSHPVAHLRAVVDELVPEPLLTAQERRDLRELITVLEQAGAGQAYLAWLPALYRETLGPAAPVPYQEFRNLHDIVTRLEDAPFGPDGIPPLLSFVHQLAALASGAVRTAFTEWTRAFADRLDLGNVQALQLRSGIAGPGLDRPETYLVVECAPDALDPGRYLMTVWLQVGREPGTPLECHDEPRSLSELPALLETLLGKNRAVVGRPSPNMVIEFVLPHELMHVAFDQLKVKISGIERRLGIEYPVVMRSFDRIRDPYVWHKWRSKWEWLSNNPEAADVCCVTQPGNLEPVFDKERLLAALSADSTTILALAFPPWGGTGEAMDELWVGLMSGIPVIAWCRDGSAAARFAEEAKELLGQQPRSLPQRMLELRQQAVMSADHDSAADHLGHHLALIFDDADRIPEPPQPLRSPV